MTSDQRASAAINERAHDAIMATIALELLRQSPADPKPFAWTSGTVIQLDPDEWVDITDPAACIPPAHVVDAMWRAPK